MARTAGALIQSLLLLGIRFCDLLSLLLISQSRRKMERIKATSDAPVSEEILCSMIGTEWSLWISSLCSTRCLAYAAITMMAHEKVFMAASLTLLLEFVVWQYFPMSVTFLALDFLMTMILTFLWPSKLSRAFRHASLGWPLGLDSLSYIFPGLWFLVLILIGSVSEVLYAVVWLSWLFEPESTALAIRMPDEKIWESLTSPALFNVDDEPQQYYSDVYGPAGFIMVFAEMCWWGIQVLQGSVTL